MKVFLTGGGGFVGLALIERLNTMGIAVTSFSTSVLRDWAQPMLAHDGFQHVKGNILDKSSVENAIKQAAPDVIIHAAGATPDAEREQAGNAAEILAINVGGTANVIEAAAAQGVSRVMAISSVSVYGHTLADHAMLFEDKTVCAPKNLYGISKFAAEQLALRLGEVHGVSVVAPRLGAAWGPWEHRTSVRATPSPMFQIVDLARRGQPIRLEGPVSAPLVYIDEAIDALVGLTQSDPFERGVVNAGARESTDLLAFASDVAQRFDVPVSIDADDPNVAVFAANRPPMSPDRLLAAIGTAPVGSTGAQIDAYLRWIEALEQPEGPFPELC